MAEDDLSKLLQDIFRSENAPPLNDAVVDAFLNTSTECPDSVIDNVRTRFVEKLFAETYHDPIMHVEQKQSFGHWLEHAREATRVSRHDVGIAVGKDERFIEAAENGTTQPWQMKSGELVKLVSLFKLHMNAVTDLVKCSFAVNNLEVGGVSARSYGGKMSPRRGSSASHALDLYLAKNSSSSESNDEIDDCLNKLRAELRQLGLNNLLD